LKIFRDFIVVGFFLAATTSLLAQSAAAAGSLAADPVFQKDCAKCHGKTATGRHFGGPSLISSKTASTSSEELRTIITNGKGRMPKFASKLAPEEIDLLVREIKAQ
jgi:cytochrome c551